MKCLGFNDSSVEILSSFLSGRMQRVVVNDETSDRIQLNHGVAQRTILGPLLLNLYGNVLELRTCEIIKYADRTVLLTSPCLFNICKNSFEHSIEDTLDYFTLLGT